MYLVCNNERGESIMCELFGFSSSKGKHLQPYLQEFFSHSVRHPNGWGLATFENGIPKVRTEMVSAEKSKVLPAIVNSLPDSQNLLAHIRRATVGGVRPENCHPFVRSDNSGRIWTLMHNVRIATLTPALITSNVNGLLSITARYLTLSRWKAMSKSRTVTPTANGFCFT